MTNEKCGKNIFKQSKANLLVVKASVPHFSPWIYKLGYSYFLSLVLPYNYNLVESNASKTNGCTSLLC